MSSPFKPGLLALVLAAIAATGAVGYWLGQRAAPTAGTTATTPSGPAASAAAPQRKLLYYRNPMGLPDTSPEPKKDSMGMDYIAVYEGEEPATAGASNTLRISADKVQKLGVRVEPATLQALNDPVRALGRVEPDERRTSVVAPKFEGYIERLHVGATGQAVAQGQLLFEAYSPELLAAQREYTIAAQGLASLQGASEDTRRGMRELLESSLAHLRHWDMGDEQLKALTQTGTPQRTVGFRSPVAGFVTEKKAVQGMRFMPGEALYQITSLATVWVIADVAEQDLARVRSGAKASVRINAYPDQAFSGTVTSIYPTLKAETRTAQVRIELPNPNGLLKLGMYAQVELPGGTPGRVMTVPNSAVLDTGTRHLVLVQVGEGRFEPRTVKVGARDAQHTAILDGVREGEPVVVAANFLIDAESNLQAAIGSLASKENTASAPAKSGQSATKSGAAVGHQAEGSVDEVDTKSGSATITHGPVASLKWPAMTMDFKLANAALAQGLKPGAKVHFEFVERAPGEWVITTIQPSAPKSGHSGH